MRRPPNDDDAWDWEEDDPIELDEFEEDEGDDDDLDDDVDPMCDEIEDDDFEE